MKTTAAKHIDKVNKSKAEELYLEEEKKEELAQEYVNHIYKRYNIDADSIGGKLIYYAYMHGMNQCLTLLKEMKG